MRTTSNRCARCGKPGRKRQIADPFCDEFEIVLCDDCYRPLVFADSRAWKWFRKYRGRELAKR